MSWLDDVRTLRRVRDAAYGAVDPYYAAYTGPRNVGGYGTEPPIDFRPPAAPGELRAPAPARPPGAMFDSITQESLMAPEEAAPPPPGASDEEIMAFQDRLRQRRKFAREYGGAAMALRAVERARRNIPGVQGLTEAQIQQNIGLTPEYDPTIDLALRGEAKERIASLDTMIQAVMEGDSAVSKEILTALTKIYGDTSDRLEKELGEAASTDRSIISAQLSLVKEKLAHLQVLSGIPVSRSSTKGDKTPAEIKRTLIKTISTSDYKAEKMPKVTFANLLGKVATTSGELQVAEDFLAELVGGGMTQDQLDAQVESAADLENLRSQLAEKVSGTGKGSVPATLDDVKSAATFMRDEGTVTAGVAPVLDIDAIPLTGDAATDEFNREAAESLRTPKGVQDFFRAEMSDLRRIRSQIPPIEEEMKRAALSLSGGRSDDIATVLESYSAVGRMNPKQKEAYVQELRGEREQLMPQATQDPRAMNPFGTASLQRAFMAEHPDVVESFGKARGITDPQVAMEVAKVEYDRKQVEQKATRKEEARAAKSAMEEGATGSVLKRLMNQRKAKKEGKEPKPASMSAKAAQVTQPEDTNVRTPGVNDGGSTYA